MSDDTKNASANALGGYESPLRAAAAETARTGALIDAIGHLSFLLETYTMESDGFALVTSLQALAQSAETSNKIAAAGLEMLGASHV